VNAKIVTRNVIVLAAMVGGFIVGWMAPDFFRTPTPLPGNLDDLVGAWSVRCHDHGGYASLEWSHSAMSGRFEKRLVCTGSAEIKVTP
jgi:hypothetical protein